MLKSRIVNIVFFVLLFMAMLGDVLGEVSVWLYVGIAVAYTLIQVYGSIVLSAQFFVPVKYQGSTAGNAVAITFDDGPIPGKTEKILDTLKACQVPAAFFCVGVQVKNYPQLTTRIHNEGHILGNHSYWHGKTFDLQSSNKIGEELRSTDEVIEISIGYKPKFFRPPYGVTNPMVAKAIKKGNYTTIGWSLRSFDTMTKNPSQLMKRVTTALKAGDIIIFHDYCDSTIEILPDLLDHISRIGFKIVRVDELLNEKAYG